MQASVVIQKGKIFTLFDFFLIVPTKLVLNFLDEVGSKKSLMSTLIISLEIFFILLEEIWDNHIKKACSPATLLMNSLWLKTKMARYSCY